MPTSKLSNKFKEIKNNKGFDFLVFLILIEMCWILGTKVSEMLLDLQIADISRVDIQRAESVYHYAVALSVLFWGLLVDRLHKYRRIILLISQFGWIGASIVLFFIPINYRSYSSIQIIWGLTFGANGPIIGSYLGDLFQINKRGKLFSIFTIFVYLIKNSAIGLTGIIGTMLGNWRAPSLIFAILGIVIMFIYIAKGKLNEIEPKLASVEPEYVKYVEKGQKYEHKMTANSLFEVFNTPTNMLFFFQGITGMIGVTIVTRYISYWFVSETGMGMNLYVSILMLALGGVIGSLFGVVYAGIWVDKEFKKDNIRSSLYFAIFCMFMQVISYAFLTLALDYPESIDPTANTWFNIFDAYPVFIGFIAVFNICVFFGTPIGTTVNVARTHINFPENRGTAAALYDLFDFIGAGIGIGIGSALWEGMGSYPKVILVGSLFWLISGLLWLCILVYMPKDYRYVRNFMQKRADDMPYSVKL